MVVIIMAIIIRKLIFQKIKENIWIKCTGCFDTLYQQKRKSNNSIYIKRNYSYIKKYAIMVFIESKMQKIPKYVQKY